MVDQILSMNNGVKVINQLSSHLNGHSEKVLARGSAI